MAEDNVTERENEIIQKVSETFQQHTLDVRRVNVQTLEGGESATLRFTIDDMASQTSSWTGF